MNPLVTSLDNVATDLRAEADPERAPQMEAYMKDRFPFLGVSAAERRKIQKPLLVAARGAHPDDLLDIADRCWDLDDREFQYVGADLLRSQAKVLRDTDLDQLHGFVTTKSWWDTVDSLAIHTIGTVVANYPSLASTMDAWIDDDDFWVARTAILHQLRYKEDADQDRLFSYVRKRSADQEFFIRKALGWALRQHARVAPEAVRAFVAEQENNLSGLTRREALKHLN